MNLELTVVRSNIDRLWAIWQELNPDSYMTLHPAPYATFNAADGETQTRDTPLAPFWNKTGTRFWTSGEVKDTHTFGYAYPETQKWRFPDQKSYQTNIRHTVVKLYGTNAIADFLANRSQRREAHTRAAKALDPRSTTDVPAAPLPPDPSLTEQEKEEEEAGKSPLDHSLPSTPAPFTPSLFTPSLFTPSPFTPLANQPPAKLTQPQPQSQPPPPPPPFNTSPPPTPTPTPNGS